jgi:hypothetical protein
MSENLNEVVLRLKRGVYRLVPSPLYAKKYFKKNYGYKFNINNPLTLNEKLWWLHIFNRDPLTTKCTDKVLVRDYVSECGLPHILNDIYATYSSPDEIDLSVLPNEFFLKCNHLSGGNFWCKNKDNFPIDEVKSKLHKQMQRNYYWNSREWNYKNIVPKIICEKVLKDENSQVGLIDYRFFCFNGEAKFLCVDIETAADDGSHYSGAKRNVYDLDFNNMNVKIRRPNFDDKQISKPKNFELMIKYANILSKSFVACRVDLYNIDGQIIFGEITFHQGGAHDITPNEYQYVWGDYLNLKNEKVIVDKKVRKKYSNVLMN